ncbi:MAG: methyltransferase domain-containing protein [Planctomycetes bacterium]|nr:methyltransferase domain-containing protein [Planctomycetota bacterium]
MSKRAPNQVERMRRLYGRQARIYDPTRAAILFGHDALVADLALEPGARVLDIGCGTGRLLPALSRVVGRSGRVVGTDCVASMLERASHRTSALPNVELVLGDREFDWPDGPFDAITLAYVLTLVPDWHDAIEEAGSRLGVDGKIGVIDFSVRPIWPIRRLFEAHRIEFGEARRDHLRTRFATLTDIDARARTGLWNYFRFTGRNRT